MRTRKMSLAPGTRLGPYEVVAAVAAGAMGEVYRARDSRLEREVALKVLPEAFANDRDRMARFEREARALAAFTHPNIVQVYDIGEEKGRAYIAMEYVDGRTLRELLDEGGLSPDQVLDFATQIASGLAKAHSAGIIHRDLKPANLIVDNDGVVKILDFGLARVVELPEGGSSVATLEPGATRAGAIVGTPAFMSPEQVKGQPVSFQSDQFSLGAILYEMAAGRPAFRRDTPGETLAAVLHDLIPKVTSMPPSIREITERCLKKEPTDRYGSTADLLEALQRSDLRTGTSNEISIAVVPFKNLSRDEDAEFFSDGLTDDVILDLSKVGRLRVISRTSAMMLKGSEKDLRTLARELGVRYVLEGNVRASGPRVRVMAQLIDAENDEHVWGERFSGTNEDLFAIQEDLSRKIVDALEVTLTPGEDRALSERPFEDIRAYECYARARQEQWGFNSEALERALRLIDDGLEIVGDHELLYAAKGAVHAQYMLGGVKPWDVALSEATRYCEKAYALGARTSQAHYLRGLLSAFNRDVPAAAKDFTKALRIQPDDPDALSWLFHANLWLGDNAAARPLLARLLEVDPLTPSNYWFAGLMEMYQASYDGAVDKMQTWADKEPSNPFPAYFLANVLARAGRSDETEPLRERVRELQPEGVLAQIGNVYQCAERGDPEGAVAAVSPTLRETLARHLGFAGDVAAGLALARATVEALAFLEQSIELGWWSPEFWSRNDPSFEYLHGDDRFERLIERARKKSAAYSA